MKLGVPVGISASAFSEVRYRANSNKNHKFDIREAYLNLNLGKFDFRVGEQIGLMVKCTPERGHKCGSSDIWSDGRVKRRKLPNNLYI